MGWLGGFCAAHLVVGSGRRAVVGWRTAFQRGLQSVHALQQRCDLGSRVADAGQSVMDMATNALDPWKQAARVVGIDLGLHAPQQHGGDGQVLARALAVACALHVGRNTRPRAGQKIAPMFGCVLRGRQCGEGEGMRSHQGLEGIGVASGGARHQIRDGLVPGAFPGQSHMLERGRIQHRKRDQIACAVFRECKKSIELARGFAARIQAGLNDGREQLARRMPFIGKKAVVAQRQTKQ